MHFLIKSPARLHMSLLDLNGDLGRIDGGFGLTLESPNTIIEFTDELNNGVYFQATSEHQKIMQQALEHFQSEMNTKFTNLHVSVKSIIPAHIGLGSKTQFLLTFIKGLDLLKQTHLSNRQLTQLAKRGGTSGVGYQAFFEGGFIVDIGHTFGPKQEKETFLPTSASTAPPAMPLIRLNFPEEWKILLLKLNVKKGANNTEEVNIFQKYCPIPLHEVEQISHRILMQIIPSIHQKNLKLFAEGLQCIENHGFKKIEISLQHPYVKKIIEWVYKTYNLPVGMSSFGPLIYIIVQNSTQLKQIQNELLIKLDTDPDSPGGSIFKSSGINRGFQRIEVSEEFGKL